MNWWQTALVIAGIAVSALSLMFTVYACIKIGAISDGLIDPSKIDFEEEE